MVAPPEDKVSLITMTHNGAELMGNCIASFFHTRPPTENFEWIIFDCGSNDDTQDFIKEVNDPRIRYFEVDNNENSFAAMNNMGAKFASGKYLWFINNDIEFEANASLWNMVECLDKYNAGCVGAMLNYPDASVQHAGVIFRPNHLPWHVRGPNYSEEYLSKDREYQAVTAACMLCKREDFFKVGGFDERYYFCFEDVDFCFKMRKVLGKKSIYCAGTKFLHHESKTILALGNKKQKFPEAVRLLRSKWEKDIEIDEYKYLADINYNVCEGIS